MGKPLVRVAELIDHVEARVRKRLAERLRASHAAREARRDFCPGCIEMARIVEED